MRNVIILGSGRSGTSMLAGTLAAAGYELGGRPYPARAANPKGFFETHAVNGVNEAILAASLPRHPRFAAGQRWLADVPLTTTIVAPRDAGQRIERLVRAEPFCFKDPRFAYTLPVWRPHLRDALFLCVFRDPAVTAASIVAECRTAPYLKGLAMFPERALGAWTRIYGHVLAKHRHAGEWRFVHYEQLLTDAGLADLAAWTGAPLAYDFPEKALDRSKSERAVPAETAEVYAELCALAGHTPARRVQVAPGRAASVTPVPETGTARPRLSVILCTYDRRAILAKSLASFFAQRAEPGTFELIVVNDGSKDGTKEYLDGLTLPVPGRILHRANGGLAAARNTGLAAARGEYLLFVNDDTIAAPDLVEQHLAAHAAQTAAGRDVAVLGTFEQPVGALDGALMRFLEVSDLVFRYGDMRDGELYDYHRFWTCNVSVRAELVHAVGGFDERFKAYGAEDIDLGFRLHERGVHVLYHAAARARHDHVLDFDVFMRRQRTCASSFVRLFDKEPRCLLHPDWSWVRGKTVADLEQAVDEQRSRVPALEAAARELAGIDLGALDASEAAAGPAVGAILRVLGGNLKALNAVWWQEGFADGLREFGLAGFPDLLARIRLPSARPAPAVFGGAELATRLAGVRALAGDGEMALATVEAIRLLRGALEGGASDPELAEVLNDLGALRFAAEDVTGSARLFEAALARAPGHALALANLADVGRTAARAAPRWGEGPDAAALPTSLNPWVQEALKLGAERIGFDGRDVLEVGGAIPPEYALGLRPARWIAGYPGAAALALGPYERRELDARALDLPDASFDVLFSSCAFEHINDFGKALAEMRRVLRPGGAIVTHFAPIWSCAVGHHLWETDANGARIMFLDRVVPDFGHLLLAEAELETYLTLVLGAESARRCVHYVFHHPCINRVAEGEFARLFRATGFDVTELEHVAPWDARHVATPRLAAELARLHPRLGNPDVPGFRGVLRRPGAQSGRVHRAPATAGAA